MTTIMGYLEHYEAVRFQALSKTFYERHIPETFPVIPILGEGFTIVRRILHSVPIHHNFEASLAPIETWLKIGPLTVSKIYRCGNQEVLIDLFNRFKTHTSYD